MTNEQRGELGKGTFSYECFGVTDIACRSGSPTFPSGIAVGGRFALDYDPGEGISPNVVPASGDSIAKLPGGFRMLRAGYAALFAVDGERRVEDLIHVRGATIDAVRVRVDGGLPVARLRLAVDEEHELSAVPMDEFDVELAGALDYEWLSEDEALFELQTLDDVDRVRVRGVSGGEASLLVRVGDAEYTLSVEVGGGAMPSPAGVASGTDAGPGAPSGDDDPGSPPAPNDAGAEPTLGDAGDAGAEPAPSDAGEPPDSEAEPEPTDGGPATHSDAGASRDGGQP